MSPERWLPIAGYEGRYEISDHGRVRVLVATTGGPPGRFFKGTPSAQGYPVVVLSLHGQKKVITIHRLVLAAFVGPCPEGSVCRHLDGDKLNNRLGNLAWGTAQENADDTRRHGRRWSKLTQTDVDEIRRLRAEGWKQQALADRWGVRQTQISHIVNGLQWRTS